MANSEGAVLLSRQKLVTTAGAAEALVASAKRVKRVQVIALSTNTKPVYVGGSDVASTTNGGLAASGSISLEAAGWMDLKESISMVSEPSPTVTTTVGPARPRLVTADQVREHIGSNSTDTDELLTRLIEEADAEVVSRYGPHKIDGPVTEVHPGGSFRLFPHRAVKEIAKVTETDGNVSVVLSDDDYRSWYGGRMLQRLADGSHPRSCWGERVELEFTPVDDDAQRRMAIIRLVQLGLPYSGLQSESVGPYRAQNLDYAKEREAILKQLSMGVPI